MGQEHDTWLKSLGVDMEKGAEAQANAGKGMVKIATGDYFRPELEVLTPVSNTPMSVPQNGELTIDLLVKNWDDAPESAALRWTVTVDGKAVVAELKNKGGQGYLTLTGKTLGGTGVARAALVVKIEDVEVPFEFTPVMLIVGPADTSLDDSRLDGQGGPATNSQLDQDVTNLLTDWESAAKTGISHFVTTELEKKINDLSAGSWASWIENLLGNTLWALTVFLPGGTIVGLVLKKEVVQFTVSLVGITAPAILNRPDGKSVPTISQLQTMLDDHIMKVHQELKQKLAPQVQKLLKEIPTMTRFEAIGKLAQALFSAGTVHVDAKYGIVPTVNETVVATRYERMAAARLKRYIDLDKEARRKEEKEIRDLDPGGP